MCLDFQFKKPPLPSEFQRHPWTPPWYRYGCFLKSPILGWHRTEKNNNLQNLQGTCTVTLEEHQSQVYLTIVPHIDRQKLLNNKSTLAWWSVIITHWFCQQFIFLDLFPNSILFDRCFLCSKWSLFRVCIEYFLSYNISNVNKTCKISVRNKQLSSIPFASSIPLSFVLHKVKNK